MYKFNIHPCSDVWIKCIIWEDLESMRKFTKRYEDGKTGDHKGFFYGPPYRFKDGELINRKAGEIHLVEGEFGVGVVSHEIQHFVTQWEDIMNWDTMGDEWEEVAYLTGDLNCEFWIEYYRRNPDEE